MPSTAQPFGDLSLRQAVNLANALGGSEAITFDPTVFATPQTITLAVRRALVHGRDSHDQGPAAGVTVSGGDSVNVIEMEYGVTVSMSGLTLTDGINLYNYDGTVTLTNCTVDNNSGAVSAPPCSTRARAS